MIRFFLTSWELADNLTWRRALRGDFPPSALRPLDREIQALRVEKTLLYKDLPSWLKSIITWLERLGFWRTRERT